MNDDDFGFGALTSALEERLFGKKSKHYDYDTYEDGLPAPIVHIRNLLVKAGYDNVAATEQHFVRDESRLLTTAFTKLRGEEYEVEIPDEVLVDSMARHTSEGVLPPAPRERKQEVAAPVAPITLNLTKQKKRMAR